MRAEVVAAVNDLAREGRSRFRASYVAERAGVSIDDARRDLVGLWKAGTLRMNLELLCPFDGATVATFEDRDRIPTTFSSWECGNGEEFEVTPELIWVTFSPTNELRGDVERRSGSSVEKPPEEVEPRGNPPGPRQAQPARASTGSRTTSAAFLTRH